MKANPNKYKLRTTKCEEVSVNVEDNSIKSSKWEL